MPKTEVLFYRDSKGAGPVWDWLVALENGSKSDKKVFTKCWVRIQLLAQQGIDLRRPVADILRDGIYELRIKFSPNEYRILYFFHDNRAVLTSAFIKKSGTSACGRDRPCRCLQRGICQEPR